MSGLCRPKMYLYGGQGRRDKREKMATPSLLRLQALSPRRCTGGGLSVQAGDYWIVSTEGGTITLIDLSIARHFSKSSH